MVTEMRLIIIVITILSPTIAEQTYDDKKQEDSRLLKESNLHSTKEKDLTETHYDYSTEAAPPFSELLTNENQPFGHKKDEDSRISEDDDNLKTTIEDSVAGLDYPVPRDIQSVVVYPTLMGEDGSIEYDYDAGNPAGFGMPDANLLPKEKYTSIDYSNRICPEYFGMRSAKCPNCVPRSCVTESDILCPYEQYTACRGRCHTLKRVRLKDIMECFLKCENKQTPTRVSAEKTIRGTIWPKVTFGGMRLIPYEIVRLPETQEMLDTWPDWMNPPDIEMHAWAKHVDFALQNIALGTDLLFVKKNSSLFRYANNGTSYTVTRHIKIVETVCLCGVNRIGRKPDDGDSEEVNETIIYFPTWLRHLRFNLSLLYNNSTDVEHYPYELLRTDTKLPCSYFEYSIYHLLLHALGFGHTNNREDRDNFLYVNDENIPDDFPTFSIGKFFETGNFEIPMFESYRRVSPLKSVMYMDGMAWAKHQGLTVFSPIVDAANPIGWQRKLEEEDRTRIVHLYGAPSEKVLNPCLPYEKRFGPRLLPEEMEKARNIKKCNDLIDSRTTIRTSTKRHHFGAIALFECRNINFVMLGDEVRICSRNGQWTGTQPVCMPAKMVNSYCSFSSDETRCNPFTDADERELLDENVRNVKRSVDKKYKQFNYECDTPEEFDERRFFDNYKKNVVKNADNFKQFESEFVSNGMNSPTDTICVGFSLLYQQSSTIEVFLHQTDSGSLVWKGTSAESITVNYIQFETKVVKEKMFKLKVICKYVNDVYLQFYMKYFYVFSGSCDLK